MANKRNLKKLIHRNCSAVAGECIAAMMFGKGVDNDKMVQAIVDAARLQQSTLALASFAFDKAPRDFESLKAYHVARRKYYAEAYSKLLADFSGNVRTLVDQMNAAVTPEGRKANLE